MIRPPKVDWRTSRNLVLQTRSLLSRYGFDWQGEQDEEQLIDAMVHVFARFGEILIDSINRAPEKNYLAFLQLLGVSNLRPRAAQVPLTFYLAGEGADFAVVPERTQVAAQPLKGEKDPILFETDRELVVVSTRFNALFVKDGSHDLYSDLSGLLPQAPPAKDAATVSPSEALPIFAGNTQITHRLYIKLAIFSPASQIDRLVVKFQLKENPAAATTHQAVNWELRTPPALKTQITPAAIAAQASLPLEEMLAAGTIQKPRHDTTGGLKQSGEVLFEYIPPSPLRSPQAEQEFWLTSSLLTPIISNDRGNATHPPASILTPEALPLIENISATIDTDRMNVPIELAFFNNIRLDLTKDFYPFGERPKFGDTLYLGSSELFSSQHAAVELKVEVTNPIGSQDNSPLPPTAPNNVKLAWEFWDGNSWSYLGTSSEDQIRILDSAGTQAVPDSFKDRTSAFSVSATITLQLSRAPEMTTINGQKNYWIRTRITSGNYGTDAHQHKNLIGGEQVPASFAPPVIRSIKADYQIHQEAPPQTLVSYNDFVYRDLPVIGTASLPVQPFEPVAAEDLNPALYFGFELPTVKSRAAIAASTARPANFPSRSMCIYMDVEQSSRGLSTDDSGSATQALTWEYWNGSEWVKWTVRDETGGFRHPGIIRFLAPTDFMASSRFGLTRYWLRATPTGKEYESKLSVALLNTVMAKGSATFRNELLGVSNGMPGQTFRLLHTPVLDGQRLEILEPRMPGHAEHQAIRQLEGEDAIQSVLDAPGYMSGYMSGNMPGDAPGHTAVWVRWHEVPDFYASTPRDRHYLLDPLTGMVTFGDGINGQPPARGSKIRSSTYRSGGGVSGNRPALNITQLKTAIPFIAKVCNWLPAGAGGDAEDNQALLQRGSRGIRHGGRAVTLQDYEDLTCLASPEVALAKCVPLLDLAANPAAKHPQPGVLSVIVVPRSEQPRPLPNAQLLSCVLAYLRNNSTPTTQISVVAPDYVRIDVTAEIVVEDPDAASEIELAVKLKLTGFLHPLSGGPSASGWSFGRMPHKSDFYRIIENISGVAYVRDVRIFAIADRPDVENGNRFLICAGEISIETSLSSDTVLSMEGAG